MPMSKRIVRALGLSLVGALILAALCAGALILGTDGADLSYRTLDYDVTATADGDLKVTEHIDIKLRKRKDDDGKTKPWKQLYQQYTLKTDNLTDITDISVRNVTNGIDYGHQAKPRLPDDVPQDEWDSIMPIIGISPTLRMTMTIRSRMFTVSFTMHDVATKWKDVATFQWEPFGENNQVPIGTVTGTVHFPKGVTASNSWTWLHTEQTSETGRTKDGSFTFTVNDVKSGEYLDVVAAFDAAKAGDMARVETDDHLQELKEDEADDERFWRNLERQRATRRLNNWMTTISAGLIFGIIGVVAALRSSGRSRYRGSIEYWRDRPELSPASAAKLIDIVTSGDKPDISERVGRTAFGMDDIKDACKDWKDGYKELEKFTNACKTEFAAADIAPKTENGWLIPGAITVLIGGASIFINGLAGYLVAGALIGIPLMTVGIFCFLMGNSYVLTDHGQQMAGQCLGLKRYMQGFSNFKYRGVADLTLWDWYMVYAAAFGISDRVMRELAMAYPQVSDPEWLDANASDTVFYWNYRPYDWYGLRFYNGSAFADSVADSGLAGAVPAFGGTSFAAGFSDLGTQLSYGFADITATINAASPSGGSGGFGGSSGGSGGGSFGGR
ncbi:DUF2207 domain-containing protein [Bifidobacterium longum]|uniref:DUF2207 domain-containing protein n=2 Tax=Bifidobacterium longum TaxID=216816 RepID=UPI002023F548|nr:DUF2207 domain-containing protein [Bifidobacterium longum]